jgi:hypothetical protein
MEPTKAPSSRVSRHDGCADADPPLAWTPDAAQARFGARRRGVRLRQTFASASRPFRRFGSPCAHALPLDVREVQFMIIKFKVRS